MLFFARIVLIVLVVSASRHASGNDPQPREPSGPPVIRVLGDGSVSRAADLVTIRFEVEATAASSAGAQAEANRRLAGVTAALEGLKLADAMIVGQSIDISPQWERVNDSPMLRVVGYRAMSRVEFSTSDVRGVGRAIDAALQAGAGGVDGLKFTLKDDAEARREAMRLATRAARAEAADIAEGLGLRITRVREASTLASDVGRWRHWDETYTLSLKSGGEPATELVPGDVRVRVQVVAVFEAEPAE